MDNQPINEIPIYPPVICGAAELTVTHLDGTEETIKVRQLGLSDLPKYGTALGDEPKMAEAATGLDAARFDSLTTESQERVVLLSQHLNFENSLRQIKRRLEADQRAVPLRELLPPRV